MTCHIDLHVIGVTRTLLSVEPLSGHFFVILRLSFGCFLVGIRDLVHDVEAVFHFPKPLSSSGNIF